MSTLKICRICLQTEVKSYNYELFKLKLYYEEILGFKLDDSDTLPHYFCFECATMLHKFHKFKEKCVTGQQVLMGILFDITYENIYKVDRKNLGLGSSLEILKRERHQFHFVKEDDDCQEIKDEMTLDYIKSEKNVCDEVQDNSPSNDLENPLSDNDDVNCNIQFRLELDPDVTDELEEGKDEQKALKDYTRDTQRFARNNLLNENHWMTINLTEKEAIQAFRAKANDKKYQNAEFKCTDCFKRFSKEAILRRHRELRHDETNRPLECRFCKMNFRWNCELKKHMVQHYKKYQCLRCNFICPFESSAILHNESHSGDVKICTYCNEEFRHSSTYYTHLRTHRSNYVCTVCGSSFVSEQGLRQHKMLKHYTNDIESPDDDDESVNTFCERCNIRFETRRAFDEHLFHSALHVQGNEGEDKSSQPPRKIFGKKLKSKITKELKSPKTDIEVSPIRKRMWRKIRRSRNKPTTCHQCGQHFDTQSACLKHHLSEHPRTSFFAENERHICEICGVSLAPGSIRTHQNMHSREKTYPCETCGKSFHSSIGLKRHLVCHTGEKPFKCSLCDKRFTQSNSRKLHYKTFHLKEPYPKRKRRQTKNEVPTENSGVLNAESETESDIKKGASDVRLEEVPESHIVTSIEYLTF